MSRTTYRTEWSTARNAHILVREKAKTHHKLSSSRTVLASAVALALTALAAPQAMAVTTCASVSGTPQIITVTGAESGCTLVAGDQLTVNVGASITDSAATPVLNSEISPAFLTNNGTIGFTYTPATGTNPWAGFWSPAVQGAFTTIINTGTIQGATFSTSGSAGIVLTGTSGTLTNSGTISAGITAVAVGAPSWLGSATGTLSSLSNSGTISSTNGTAIVVANGSNLTSFTNEATGTITGASGFSATGVTMDAFVNQGIISGSSSSWSGGTGVSIMGTSSPSFNGATTVWNSSPAILSGGLTNSGTISGTSAGVVLDTVVVGSVGTPADITNQTGGSIIGGLAILGSTLHGDIINQTGATIDGATASSSSAMGVAVLNSTLGSISNSGTIGGGIVLRSNSAMSGSITNASGGVITASGWGGIQVDGSSVAGDVNNAGGITMAGRSAGIDIKWGSTVSGSVSNTGTITYAPSSSSSSSGVGIAVNGATVGSISNSGIIDVSLGAIGIDIGPSTTVNGAVTNTASGVISAGSIGVNLHNSTMSSFSNQGSIVVSGSSAWTGLSIFESNITGGVSNSGTISTTGRDGVVFGASATGSSVGSLTNTNTGTIQGAAAGVVLGTSTFFPKYTGLQTINNSGLIAGQGWTAPPVWLTQNGIGIYLKNADLVSITNSGTISGSVAAIRVNTTTATSTLGDIFISGNNTAQFNGMVDAQATNVSILAGQTYTLRGTDDFRVASFTNNGTAQFAAGATNFTLANVTGNTFTNNGVLSVGAADTGTLTGNYTQAATGTLQIGASGDATYGKLVVTGTATLPTNARIDVNVTNPNFSFTTTGMAGVLTAGTLTSDGTFAVTDNSALFDFTASLNGNAVDLALAAVSSGGTSTLTNAFNTFGSPAGAGAARAIDSLLVSYTTGGTTGNAGMDAVLAQLGTYTTDAELVAAVMQTVPQVGAAMKRVSASARAGVTAALAARIRSGSGQSSGDGFVTDGNVWVKPLGAWAKQDDNGGIPGYKSNTYGLVAGADGETAGGSRIGMALGVTSTSVDANGGLQSGKVAGYQLALYGSKDMAGGSYIVDWQADYSYNRNTSDRSITFMGTTASSDYTGTAAHLGAGLSSDWTLASGDVLTPSLHVDYTSLRNDGYTETGAGALNLTVDGQSFRELLYVADVMWTHSLASGSLTANLGAAYDAYAKQDDITSTYAGGGAAFGTSGIEPSPTTIRAGLGYAQTTAGGMEVSLRYDVESRSGYAAQSISAKLGKPF